MAWEMHFLLPVGVLMSKTVKDFQEIAIKKWNLIIIPQDPIIADKII